MFFELVVFLLGASLGSFLMVWAERGSFLRAVTGRSMCAHCKTTLPPLHLVPVLSWLGLRGRCGYCKRSISLAYPLFEAGLGLALALLWVSLIGPAATLADAHAWSVFARDVFFTLSLALLFLFDLRRGLLPDRITLPAIVIALVWNLLLGKDVGDLLWGMLLVGGFFLIQYLVSKGRWVGGGDIRMGALMGAMLGLVGGIQALFVAYIVGAVVALILLAEGRATMY